MHCAHFGRKFVMYATGPGLGGAVPRGHAPAAGSAQGTAAGPQDGRQHHGPPGHSVQPALRRPLPLRLRHPRAPAAALRDPRTGWPHPLPHLPQANLRVAVLRPGDCDGCHALLPIPRLAASIESVDALLIPFCSSPACSEN